ncbi:MAG: serpin family protein [Planctomycetota bacterium]|jgi:serpin B
MNRRGRKTFWTALLGTSICCLLCISPDLASAEPEKGDCETIIQGNTRFALDLFAMLGNEEGNLFLSPYSLSAALAMTCAGARGETERQMAEVLHFALDRERLHPVFAEMLAADLSGGNRAGYELSMANALWGQEGNGFLDDFLSLAKQHYGAGLGEVDFTHATEEARRIINEWIELETAHKVKEMIHKEDLSSEVVLVLTNAIDFKGKWVKTFDEAHTEECAFRVNRDSQVMVPMMYKLAEFRLAQDANVNILELPYEGDRLSMLVLLPKDVHGLRSLERSLSPKKLEQWLDALRAQPVKVLLPRFDLQSRFNLKKILIAMGMTDAFGIKNADFSGMTGNRELFISDVIHQASVEVDEEGSKAAAATAIIMEKKGPRFATFQADHPFMFLIRDRQSSSILFMGRVVDPFE